VLLAVRLRDGFRHCSAQGANMAEKTAPGRNPGNTAIIETARRGAMLVDLVRRSIGDNLRRSNDHRWEANSEHCPACRRKGTSANALSVFHGSDGNWRWKCQSCGEGGTAIDWMIAVSGNMSVLEAARAAVGNEAIAFPAAVAATPAAADVETEAEKEKTRALVHCIDRIRANVGWGSEKVLVYLRSRGISDASTAALARNGNLCTLPVEPYLAHRMLCEVLANEQHSGEAWLMKSGLMKEGARLTALAYRPLLFLGTTWLEARIIRAPKDKDEPKGIRYGKQSTPLSFRNGNQPVAMITVVEGPIDLLSKIELGVKPNQILVCVPGVVSWKPEWLTAGVKGYPTAVWELALDNDEPGDTAAEKMGRILAGVGGVWRRCLPFVGKDINDELMSMRTAV